jgi:hypothetical protein
MRIRLRGLEMLGRQAPPLSVMKWFDSEPVVLDELLGEVVLLQVGGQHSSRRIGASIRFSQDDTLRLSSRRYGTYGLEVVSVHHSLDVDWGGPVGANVERLATDLVDIGLDANRKTWTAYRADVTPTLYLIDKQGYVRMVPTEDEAKRAITTLLAE